MYIILYFIFLGELDGIKLNSRRNEIMKSKKGSKIVCNSQSAIEQLTLGWNSSSLLSGNHNIQAEGQI